MTTTDSASAGVTGINTDRVPDWLAANVSGLRAPFSFELIAGGRSNMTFGVTDAAGRKVVLRRPPMSHVLASAHDMGREHRIISALADTPVPVPATLGYCDDESVNERPFYVMDFVDGLILRNKDETAARFDEAARRGIGENLVDVLAAIHDVDVDAVGLGTLARKEGYIARQLKRWNGQFEQSQEQEKEAGDGVYRAVPLVTEVHARLASQVPEQVGAAIVHGDYRLDNTILSPDGRVKAVLDWELCTLGDPLADVGTLLMYWAQATSSTQPVTAMPGFPTREELAARYAAASGRDVAQIGFYMAFAYWKLACIMEGVYVRYATHAMGGGAEEAESLGARVQESARQAMTILDS
jgi:aminoglycoside phosphotransferase (APT) family kinase protein